MKTQVKAMRSHRPYGFQAGNVYQTQEENNEHLFLAIDMECPEGTLITLVWANTLTPIPLKNWPTEYVDVTDIYTLMPNHLHIGV